MTTQKPNLILPALMSLFGLLNILFFTSPLLNKIFLVLVIICLIGTLIHSGFNWAFKALVYSNILWIIAFGAFQLAVAAHPDQTWHQQILYEKVLGFPFKRLIPFWGLALFFWLFNQIYLKHKNYFQKKLKPSTKYLPWIGLLFVMALLISNITTQKISHFWGITVDVGTWFFPVTYIFNDIFTEVYGYAQTRKYIWIALFTNSIMICIFFIIFNGSVFTQNLNHTHAFHIILMTVPRIFLASLCSFFCGEFLNAFVLAKLKIKMRGKFLPIRTISSTGVGVIVDSIIFVVIAFAGTLPINILFSIALWEFILKFGYEILATPLTCILIKWLKKQENKDIYDTDTQFSPFKFN